MIGIRMQSSTTINGTSSNTSITKDNNKKIKLSDIWKVIDQEIGGTIPNYLKQLLTCGGYDTITVLEYLNTDEIIEIENYGKNKFLFDLKDEDEINDFLNMCPDNNPKNFILKRGHKLLLECLAKRINIKGVDYFIEKLKLLNKSNNNNNIKYRFPTFRQYRPELKYGRKRFGSDVQLNSNNNNNNQDDGSSTQFEPMVTIKQKRFSDADNDDGNSQDIKYNSNDNLGYKYYENSISDPLKDDLSTDQQSPINDYTEEKLAEQAEGLKTLANGWIERKLICDDVSKYLVTNTQVITAKTGILEGFIQCVCGSFIKVQHDVRYGQYRWAISNFSRHVAKHESVLPPKVIKTV